MNSTLETIDRPSTALGPQLRRRKSISSMLREAETNSGHGQLRRSLGVVQLTMISIGATMGTGILVILGATVPIAGPAIWISFVIAGVTALLSAVSYAEMAGMVPVAGSSYSYSYATMGEGIAWICGWCLVLEYAVSVAAVAVGAGEYVNETLRAFGLELPTALAGGPAEGGVANLPALIVVVLATLLLVRGAKESAWVNTVVVIIKASILLLFCAVAFSAFNAGNFEPLLPMGAAGVTAAASTVFFSYIGFDAASTAGEEAVNPKRDMPRAILWSMLIVTITYVLVAVSAIGAREWNWFEGTEAALVQIIGEVTGQPWLVLLFAVAAVLAIASVVLTVLYGQTRILLSMSRDGLIPKTFGEISSRTGTPVRGTLITGFLVAATAGFIPLGALADATSIGTLFAFALVGVSVMYLRRRQPLAPRTFRVPFYPLTPILGVAACVFLMSQLGPDTWFVFGIWMLAGIGIYLGYGRSRSRLGQLSKKEYIASHIGEQ
ncbi:amino acid permease [Arthrobacter sp. MYb211]|uniref:amino acid permease n=1 Tax=unclassified Arthrobacter TaxID=235627 RepID=UPI000CFCBEF4|nr:MULTISPECIES: amino acid permease [unclassified Arthrobacter]PQZ98891.1 amino acid permease [Arthrobacter sp. MYb224]PRA03229.1 amino acid permease [Arthrobacter sp. MYb229]PRA11881.1 amino acid permease [Arthrobacter sp. MYb221]PRB49699.1 amino acid permease [Arthrobacter sp. MYb216]PRC08236.1 amino acid permease [Arthrobacter sp. MYb211]